MPKRVVQAAKNGRHHPIFGEVYKLLAVVVGAVLQGIGLELFLIPNGFLDGGIIGVSIIAGTFVSLPIGVFIAVLNAPFIVLTWMKLGRRVAIKTILGVSTLALTTILLHHSHPLTDEFSLALGYGGLLIGLGTGLALRAGGALDGTEALASFLSHKSAWSVDQLILFINIGIFGVAALVLTPETAMASALLFYVVVAPIIKRVVDGGEELKMAEILTVDPAAVTRAIHTQNKRKVLRYSHNAAIRDSDSHEMTMLKLIVSRMEEVSISDVVLETDPEAIIIFHEVANVRGSIYESRPAH